MTITLPDVTNANIINGTIGNDNITGTAGFDAIYGGAGNDYIDGGDGRDSLGGGDGDDTLVGGSGTNGTQLTPANGIDGGAGYDTALYTNAQSNYMVNVIAGATPTIRITDLSTGSSDLLTNVERLVFADTTIDLVAPPIPTPAPTPAPTPTVINGTTTKDVLAGTAGDDAMSGLAGNDTIHGNTGNDIIAGDTGNDKLFGDDGNDTLIGGAGNDSLQGDAGNDVFLFNQALLSTNVDKIMDFSVTEDKIALDHSIFTALASGAFVATEFNIGSHASTANQHIIYNDMTGKLYYDADGSGHLGKVQIASLDIGLHLTDAHFILV
jgi:Ca2+-binding RTX toxin-like protein